MATLEEVKAAEERMNAAKAALLDYAERPATQGRDADLQRRLSEELARSTKEFLTPYQRAKSVTFQAKRPTGGCCGSLTTLAYRPNLFIE
jgi:nucleoid-associated protein YejK